MRMDVSDQPSDDESTASEQDEEEEEEENSTLQPLDVKAEPGHRNAANEPTGRHTARKSIYDDGSSTDGSSSSSLSDVDEEVVKPAITNKADVPSATRHGPRPFELATASSLNPGPEGSAVNSRQPPPPPPPKAPLKRVRTESLAVGGDATQTRPAKRIKERGAFNKHYFYLLNQEIQAAAGTSFPEPPDGIPPSQIGFTVWTTAEKEAFFTALSRLGRHNTPAITARIPTKTQFEVAQYLELLESTCTKLANANAGAGHDPNNDLKPLLPCDIPAAVEISTYCSEALERAADRLALRQERQEQEVEKQRWGNESWLIRKANIARIEKLQDELRKNLPQPEDDDDVMVFDSSDGEGPPPTTTAAKAKSKTTSENKDSGGGEKLMKSIELFKVKNWLELSERVFMNSARREKDGSGNWMTMPTVLLEEENLVGMPAIRVTALEDFYSLVVSLTRRIVAAVVYVSGARVRAKGELRTRAMKPMVWKEDIEAAVASLRLGGTSEWAEFWGLAPRRLGLEVVRGGEIPLASARRVEVMGYDEVEKALLPGRVRGDGLARRGQEDSENEESEDEDEEEEIEEDEEDEEERQVNNQMDEAVEAVRPFVIHPGIKELMRTRIRAAREQDGFANQLDLEASVEEENRLWGVLGKRSSSVVTTQEGGGNDGQEGQTTSGRPPRLTVNCSVDDLYEDYCDGGAGRAKDAIVALGTGAKWELDWVDEKKQRGEMGRTWAVAS